MHCPKFEHLRPASLNEATQLLTQYGHRARVMAGGTDLLPRLKYRLACPEAVISLKGIPVRPPRIDAEGNLHLDALTVLSELIQDKTVQDQAPLLVEAAQGIGSHQIRNMGTLGGNLGLETRCLYYNQSHSFQFVDPCFKRGGGQCYLLPQGKKCLAVFSADTVPALICLKARLIIAGSHEDSEWPIEQLYSGDAVNPLTLSASQLIREIIIPPKHPINGWAFMKLSIRGGLEFAGSTVAVNLDLEEDRTTCREARMAVGSVSAAPIGIRKAIKSLVGQKLSKDGFEEAARLLSTEVHPVPHHGYSQAYLREGLEIQARRALILAAEGLQKKGAAL